MSTMADHAEDGHGHHDHPPFQQHHFDTPEQQEAASKFGMWLFLGTEVLMFSGLFMAYAVLRYLHPDMMLKAHESLNVPLGALNTVVLLTSSLTMALAVRAAQTNNQKSLNINLLLTIGFAFVFLIVKYFEYAAKIEHMDLPGKFYHAVTQCKEMGGKEICELIYPCKDGVCLGPYPGGPQTFFAIYFCMTGLHGIHVVIGIGVLIWIWMRGRKGDFNSQYYTPVENVGLYWHLVDLVWIYLFPLLYLVK